MNNLKVLFTVGVVLLILLSTIGCDSDESSSSMVKGSGNLDTQEIDFSDFTKIEVDHAFQVQISMGDIYYVNITLDNNLFNYLTTEITGDTLYIGLEPDNSNQNTTKKVNITLPDLRSLRLSGASSANVSGLISATSLQVEVPAAGRLFFQDVEVGDTLFNISGASDVSGSIETV